MLLVAFVSLKLVERLGESLDTLRPENSVLSDAIEPPSILFANDEPDGLPTVAVSKPTIRVQMPAP